MSTAPLQYFGLQKYVYINFSFAFCSVQDALFPDFVSNPFPYISFQSRWFEAFACCSGDLCADGNRRMLNEALFFPLTLLIGIPLTDI